MLALSAVIGVLSAGCESGAEEVGNPSVGGAKLTPFERHGRLQILGGQLSNEAGNPVLLRGMSSFGLQWSDGYWALTEEAFDVLADDWQCDLIRFAMYVTENGYASNPAVILERLEKGIQLATERGMYVIVDWHVLTPGDPMDSRYLEAGLGAEDMPGDFLALRDANPGWTGPQVFFAYIAQKYGHQGNILYEPANEPNRLGSYDARFDVWSEKLKPYYESIIPVIRMFDEDGIVICGTDNWSQYVDGPVHDPIDDPQVMYALHFYTGTHDAGYDPDPDEPSYTGRYWLRRMTDNALAHGLAIFATEWGVSTASGDGGPYIDFAERWVLYMEENGISWAAWSMALKNEVSAAFLPGASHKPVGAWPDDELSVAGRFYRSMIRGEGTPMYVSYTLITDFNTGSPMFGRQSDNPNRELAIERVTVDGINLAKVTGVTPDSVWNNRISMDNLKILFGVYQNLAFDVYLDADKVDISSPDTAFSVKPVFQYPPNWWYDQMPEIEIAGNQFAVAEGTGLAKASVSASLRPLSPRPAETVEHLVLLIALGPVSEGSAVYIGNVAFSTGFNGDISLLPEIPDEPGMFIKLPFDFESGTREGWIKEGESRITNAGLSIGVAETKALMFPAEFAVDANRWEDGVRLSSPHALGSAGYTAEYWANVTAITIDVYLEPDKATTGILELHFIPVPGGGSYWHEAGAQAMDPVNGGETVTTPDGRTLLKFTLIQPFSVADYTEAALPRNLVLALAGEECDYTGYIWYDNIGFISK